MRKLLCLKKFVSDDTIFRVLVGRCRATQIGCVAGIVFSFTLIESPGLLHADSLDYDAIYKRVRHMAIEAGWNENQAEIRARHSAEAAVQFERIVVAMPGNSADDFRNCITSEAWGQWPVVLQGVQKHVIPWGLEELCGEAVLLKLRKSQN